MLKVMTIVGTRPELIKMSRVIAEFDSGGLLQPGMFGRIGIDYDKRANATVVPRAALLDAGTNAAVFAVRDGKAARVPVTLGYMDGQWAEVREGLAVGEQVVVAGKAALRDGSAVTVIGQPGDKAVAASEGGAVAPVANNQ